MAEYIEREAFKEAICEWCNACFEDDPCEPIECDILSILRSIPAADVRPVVRGKWIEVGEFEQCSVCLGTHLKQIETYYGTVTWIKTDYCPNCGAKMDGEV